MKAPTRPVLRYHGGKWRLAPWVIEHFPPHRIYVEPYGGAGSVLMRKERSFAEVYNDLDADIVNLFRVLRSQKGADELIRLLELTPWSRREFIDSYEPCADPVERARRTVARSFMAFGTTSRRKNMTGFRGKAYSENQTGVADWIRYPAHLSVIIARLQGVLIEERDALEVIRHQDGPDTLFYADPPYPTSTRTSVQWESRNDRAYAVEMDDDDHRALAAVLRSVNGMVVLSGYPCDLYDFDLYPDWKRFTKSSLADGARKRTEVLWLNDRAAAGMAQGSLL